MPTDPFGNPVSDCTADLAATIDDVILGFLAYHPRAVNILRCTDAHPDHFLSIVLWTGPKSTVKHRGGKVAGFLRP